MRPSSRRRVASWLLALPSGRGEECARRGRLEMISFWLLCWKLLRATAGLRRTTAELTDGNPGNDNPGNGSNGSPGNGSPGNDSPGNDAPPPAVDSVTMEISPSPPLTDLERENLFSCRSPEDEELHYPEGRAAAQQNAGEENGKGDECDYLVFEIGEKGRERGGGGGEEGGDRGETEGGDEGRGEVEGEEEGRGETEGGGEGGRREGGEEEERRRVDGGDGSRGADVWGGRREVDGEDEGGRRRREGEDGGREEAGGGGRGEVEEEEGWMGEMKDDTLSDLLLVTDSCSAWSHAPGNRDDLSDGHLSDGHLSDDHLSDGHLSDGHLSDCLQAELAVVYSDSDAGEDQWAAFAPGDVSSQVEGERPDRSEDKQVRGGGGETRREEKREEQREQDSKEEEKMRTRRDLFLRSPSVSSTTSSTDPDRRVPADFSVHQDTLSEHVSTEHVDFMLARQQWRKMEEEVKGFPIPKPGLRAQSSFQGTHSSLYPPTRSPRLKHREVHPPGSREPPLSSTMSPSSEDSGLDDSSYRSPLEEPETAVEREIRMTLEREERHRRERGMIAQGLTLPRPSTLQTGRSPPRPPACRTPTLSISPSPSCSSSLPRSVYHEMTANNVIILEPDPSSGSSSRSRLLTAAVGGASDAVPSGNVIVVETSNLIIRSASEFCLSSAPVSVETQESTFTCNPFFKLRSLSSQSLVEQEIRLVRQREDEWRRQREEVWRRRREEEWRRGRERYDTVLVSPGLTDSISFNVPEVADRSVSSPSSPSRTRKMERSSLSCDHKLD